MLRNYLLVTLRNIVRDRAISVIHITGLGLGLAALVFAVLTMAFEYSFDNFHVNRDRLLYIHTQARDPDGTELKWLATGPAFYYGIREKVHEAEFVSRYFSQSGREPYCVVSYRRPDGKEILYNEQNARYVDADFLRMFSFPVLKGSRDGQLGDATSIVITRSVASKYFGDEDPLGKILELRTGGSETHQTKFTYQVTAVLDDIPLNSSLQFDILLPFRNFEDHYVQDVKNNWWWPSFFTFVKTRREEVAAPISQKINELVPEEARKWMAAFSMDYKFTAKPLSGFHFEQDALDVGRSEIRTANKTYTNIIGLIGLSILVIAGVNYVNLTTARSLKRAREVGVRKVVGASRSQLVRQFLLDALVVNVLAFAFGLTLLQLARPVLEYLTGYKLDFSVVDHRLMIMMISILFVSTSLTGLIPAFFLTGFRPSAVLKGQSMHSLRGRFLRKGLVVSQFVVSVSLVVFTLVIYLQIKYLRTKDRGFNAEQRIVIKNFGSEDFNFSKYNTFKKRIESHKDVLKSTASMYIPGSFELFTFMVSTSDAPDVRVRLNGNAVDYDFVATLGAKLKAGRDFNEAFVMGEKQVIVNESAVRLCGYKSNQDAVGQTLRYYWPGKEGEMDLKIIGVVSDFNSVSPGSIVTPEIFVFRNTAHPYGEFRYYTVHVASAAVTETMDLIRAQWNETFDRAPFTFVYLDANFERVFEQDRRTQAIAGISMLLSILIACMGLGGLVAFTAGQRVKEIGIRKVLGASVSRILLMLSKDFVLLVLVADVVALPVSYIVVERFLQNYEYRIDPSLWMYLASCLVLLVIVLVTVSYQTLKAARSNPVEALKYE
ncbi:MAG: ABC transporter permease [Chryseolinea sp.]